MIFNYDKQYISLIRVFEEALEQAQSGKGKERHVENNEAFDKQQICEIGRRLGYGFNLGQAVKKIYEVKKIKDTEAKIRELLGAINYIASGIILIRELNND